MARNYAALPYEYIEEMAALDNETFGRLVRYLLLYSRDGALPDLAGLEMVIFQRMKMQEDRYKESYDNLSSTRSAAGKAGAAIRWNDSNKVAGDSKNSKGIAKHDKNSKAMASDSKNGNTKTETETDTPATNVAGEGREKRQSRFSPPARAEVAAYCAERGNAVDPDRFWDHYEANGWMVGKNKMRDWKAAVRNWEKREREFGTKGETANERYSRELQELIAADATGGGGFDPWRSG